MNDKTFIGWYSGGVTSAVAIKLALNQGYNVQIYFFETLQHHPDNMRFLRDCEKWYGQKIHVMRNKKAGSVKEVLSKGYINSPGGAFCTYKLKKEMRWKIEEMVDFDYQIFGFEHEKRQIARAERFMVEYPDSHAVFPLIQAKMNKMDCMKLVQEAGIELPMMYRLGYSNANCIGCVKGGMGYWNKVRVDFPEIFKQTAELERKAGYSCINGVFLDELDPERGRHEDIELPECGVVCAVEGSY